MAGSLSLVIADSWKALVDPDPRWLVLVHGMSLTVVIVTGVAFALSARLAFKLEKKDKGDPPNPL